MIPALIGCVQSEDIRLFVHSNYAEGPSHVLLLLIHPSSRSISIRMYVRGGAGAHHADCFSLKDEMV